MRRIDLGDIGNVAEAIADDITDFQLGLAQNSDLTRIYLAGLEDPEQRYAAIGSGMRCSLFSGQMRGGWFVPLYLPA